MRPAVRLAVVLLSTAVLQWGVFSQLRIGGAAADLFLIMAVTAGMTSGPDRGAVMGFFAGLTLDLLTQTPLGLGALVYGALGYLSGRVQGTVMRANRLLPPVLTAGLCSLGVLAYAVAAWMLGQANVLNQHLLTVIVVVAISSALLAPAYLRIMRWVWRDDRELRPLMH